MKTRGELFAGVTVAIVTPFKNGEVDWDDLGKLVDWHVEQGTDALAPCGTTGESPTLDHDENEKRRRVRLRAGARADQGHGRHRVEQHGRSDPHDEGREEGRRDRHAASRPVLQQADAGRLLPPLRRRRRGRATCRMCSTTSPAAPASNILPETIARMAEKYPTIVAVKEATGSLDQASQIAALCDLTHPERRRQPDAAAHEHRRQGRGQRGRQHRAARHDGAGARRSPPGSSHEALKWHRKLFPLCRDMLGVATNPIPVKAAMKLLGRGNGELRLPMTPLDAAGEAKIAATLTAYGLM